MYIESTILVFFKYLYEFCLIAIHLTKKLNTALGFYQPKSSKVKQNPSDDGMHDVNVKKCTHFKENYDI